MPFYARIAFLLTALVLPSVAAAQSPAAPDRDHGWFTIGYGPTLAGDLGASVTANIGRTRNVQLGYHAAGVIWASLHAVNAGVGRSVVSRYVRFAASAGPAVVWWDGGDPFTTVGAVLSTQFIVTPVKEIGLGLELWGNLNVERSVGGASILLVLEGNK